MAFWPKKILDRTVSRLRARFNEKWMEELDSPWVIAELEGGLRVWCNLIDQVSKTVLKGDYSPAITQLIKSHYRPGTTFCDLGANIGWFTLVMAQEIEKDGSNGRVVAFEPQPDVAYRLRGSIEENGFGGVVDLFELALSDEVREYSMVRENTNIGGGTISEGGSNHKNEMSGIKSCLFDDLCDDFGEVSVMKIDIEGSEMNFFGGAKRFFSEQKPVLITEVHNRKLAEVSKSNSEEYLETIRSHGYRIFEARGDLELVELDFAKFQSRSSFDVLAIPK